MQEKYLEKIFKNIPSMANCPQNPNFFGLSHYRAMHAQKLEKGVFSFEPRHSKTGLFFWLKFSGKIVETIYFQPVLCRFWLFAFLPGIFFSEVENRQFF